NDRLEHEQGNRDDEPVPDAKAPQEIPSYRTPPRGAHYSRVLPSDPQRSAVQRSVCGTLPLARAACAAGWPANASDVICARPAIEPITDAASSGIRMTFWFGALASDSRAFT